MANFESLPSDLGRRRMLGTEQTAEFLDVSIPHLRRLCREGKIPKPVKIGSRKNGWAIGTLADFVDAKAASAA